VGERGGGGGGGRHLVLVSAPRSDRGGTTSDGQAYLARDLPLEPIDLCAGPRGRSAQGRLGSLLAVPHRNRDRDLASDDRLVEQLPAVVAAHDGIRDLASPLDEGGFAFEPRALAPRPAEIGQPPHPTLAHTFFPPRLP